MLCKSNAILLYQAFVDQATCRSAFSALYKYSRLSAAPAAAARVRRRPGWGATVATPPRLRPRLSEAVSIEIDHYYHSTYVPHIAHSHKFLNLFGADEWKRAELRIANSADGSLLPLIKV